MKQFRLLEWALIFLTVVICLVLLAIIALTPDQVSESNLSETIPVQPTDADWPDVSPDDVQYLSQRFQFGELQLVLHAFHQNPADSNRRNDYCLVNVSTTDGGQLNGRLVGSMYAGNEYYPLLDYTARLAANLDDLTRPMEILPEATNIYTSVPDGEWSFFGDGVIRLLVWGSRNYVINGLELIIDCSQGSVNLFGSE